MTSQLPEQFGRYRILRKLGKGGMGTVYLAHDTQLQRRVALKVPHIDADAGPGVLQRFYREARSAATLNHPNICPVYDVGSQDDVPFLTMAYVEGQTLAAMIEDGKPLPERAAIRIVATLAQALYEAHSRGVIHRDLKPANVMMNPRNEPVVMDFGLARQANRGASRQTGAGAVIGTPAYMPPEQVRGDVDAMGQGCDIYSLGVILYELLTGRVPFEGPVAAVLGQILTQEPKPPSTYRPDLDPRLESVCLRALQKDIAARFGSMSDMAWALNECLRPVATVPPKKPAQAAAPAKPAPPRETAPVRPRPDTRRPATSPKAARDDTARRRKASDTMPAPIPKRSLAYRMAHSCISIVALLIVIVGVSTASLIGYVVWTGSTPAWLPNWVPLGKLNSKDAKPPPLDKLNAKDAKPPPLDKLNAKDEKPMPAKPVTGKTDLTLQPTKTGSSVTLNGQLTDADPRDKDGKHFKTYTIVLEAGKTYLIQMKGQAKLDAFVRLEDETGKLIRKEEFTDANGSSIRYTADKTATYRIGASTYVPNTTGTFTLDVKHDDGMVDASKGGFSK